MQTCVRAENDGGFRKVGQLTGWWERERERERSRKKARKKSQRGAEWAILARSGPIGAGRIHVGDCRYLCAFTCLEAASGASYYVHGCTRSRPRALRLVGSMVRKDRKKEREREKERQRHYSPYFEIVTLRSHIWSLQITDTNVVAMPDHQHHRRNH